MLKCLICRLPIAEYIKATGEYHQYNCKRCAQYMLHQSIETNWFDQQKTLTSRQIANISGWIRENQGRRINFNDFMELLELPTPSIAERGIKILNFFNDKLEEAGKFCEWRSFFPEVLSVAWASSDNELTFIIYKYLWKDRGFVDVKNELDQRANLTITPAGYSYLENITKANPESNIAFCAMWFDQSLASLWDDGIHPAILDSGYEPKIIRKHPYNEGVVDEIISLIRRSKFIIADLTGKRGGVYFEAGFAKGLGLPVIFTCKKSLLDEADGIHFDVKHYNLLTWESDKYPEFKEALQYRIEATLGRGKNKVVEK